MQILRVHAPLAVAVVVLTPVRILQWLFANLKFYPAAEDAR